MQGVLGHARNVSGERIAVSSGAAGRLKSLRPSDKYRYGAARQRMRGSMPTPSVTGNNRWWASPWFPSAESQALVA